MKLKKVKTLAAMVSNGSAFFYKPTIFISIKFYFYYR